ncbi:MAG: hypothetical protein K2X07_09835 [Caulobacteraceae bacterium]|nr:hypothetical protein [Caulobacteraceae bacterium]
MRALIWLAALFGTGCSADFWDMNPPTRIEGDPAVLADLQIDRVEVRSAFYNPPDAFSQAFVPALMARTDACLGGDRGATAAIFIHELDRRSDLADGGDRLILPGSVDVRSGSRVVARLPVRVDVPMPTGDVDARRRAAGDAFGQAICAALTRR